MQPGSQILVGPSQHLVWATLIAVAACGKPQAPVSESRPPATVINEAPVVVVNPPQSATPRPQVIIAPAAEEPPPQEQRTTQTVPAVNQDDYLQNARLAYGQQRYADAEVAYLQATKDYPSDPRIWSSLGNARMMLQKGDLAADAFQEAVRLDPANANYYLRLGDALYMNGNGTAAKDAFVKADKIDPGNPQVKRRLQMVADNPEPIDNSKTDTYQLDEGSNETY